MAMAWRRKGGDTGEARAPPPQVSPAGGLPPLTDLPRGPDVGTTTERDATKRLRRAEADLKRLERREARAKRAQARRERAIERRLSRIQLSKERQPISLVALLLVTNGIAIAFAIVLLLFPEWPLYEPILYTDSAHWEVIVICLVAGSMGSSLLLAGNPADEYQDRARRSLYVYFGTALTITFSGALVALVLTPIQDMDRDWGQVLLALVVISAVAALAMVGIYLTAHSMGPGAYLGGRYHAAMGVLTALIVVSLLLLGLFFIASEDVMVDVGLAMMVAGGLGMLFPLTCLVASFAVERFRDVGVVVATLVMVLIVLVLVFLSTWILDVYMPELFT